MQPIKTLARRVGRHKVALSDYAEQRSPFGMGDGRPHHSRVFTDDNLIVQAKLMKENDGESFFREKMNFNIFFLSGRFA